MAAISIANPVAQIPQIAPIPSAATPAAAPPAAPEPVGMAAPVVNPVQAAADEAQASNDEFTSAWKTANAPAATPLHNGGLNLTDEAKGIQSQLDAKTATAAPLSSTDQYSQAWLNEQKGVYGDLGAAPTPTTHVEPPPPAPEASDVTDEMREIWRNSKNGTIQWGGIDRTSGFTAAQRKVLEAEDAAEAKAQEEFNRRYAAYQQSQLTGANGIQNNGQYSA